MDVLSLVYIKAVFILLKSNAELSLRSKNHDGAGHEVSHNTIKNWHQRVFINAVKQYLVACDNLEQLFGDFTRHIIYSSRSFNCMIFVPKVLFFEIVVF